MKGNEFSIKNLNANAESWIAKLVQVMTIQEYGKGSIRKYIH